MDLVETLTACGILLASEGSPLYQRSLLGEVQVLQIGATVETGLSRYPFAIANFSIAQASMLAPAVSWLC